MNEVGYAKKYPNMIFTHNMIQTRTYEKHGAKWTRVWGQGCTTNLC